jgi:hypothetical protein
MILGEDQRPLRDQDTNSLTLAIHLVQRIKGSSPESVGQNARKNGERARARLKGHSRSTFAVTSHIGVRAMCSVVQNGRPMCPVPPAGAIALFSNSNCHSQPIPPRGHPPFWETQKSHAASSLAACQRHHKLAGNPCLRDDSLFIPRGRANSGRATIAVLTLDRIGTPSHRSDLATTVLGAGVHSRYETGCSSVVCETGNRRQSVLSP